MSGGLVGLGLILAGLLVLFLEPLGFGTVRLGGVSVAWWYGGLVAPILALVVTLASRPGARDDPPRSR